MLIEPMLASSASLGIYLLNQIWGGAVAFDRDDIVEAAFLDELRRTVSDGALLMEHLEVTSVRRTHLVPIGETVRGTVERMVRWTKIIWQHDPAAIAGAGLILLLALADGVLFPFYAAVVLAAFHLAVNEVLGVRRWTALLAYPSVFAFVPLVPYALARRTFVWGTDAIAGGRSSTWRLSSNARSGRTISLDDDGQKRRWDRLTPSTDRPSRLLTDHLAVLHTRSVRSTPFASVAEDFNREIAS